MKYYLFNSSTRAGCEVRNAADRDIQLAAMGEGTTWEELPDDPIVEIDPAAKLAADRKFGAELIDVFLLDNRADPNVRTSDSLALLQKFGPAENLLRLGDIKKCRVLIDSFVTDLIFTVDRKTKYLAMIDAYLNG